MSKETNVMSKDEKKLRKDLWLNHGCSFNALDGDDEKMQCNSNDCRIDFKREPLSRIQDLLFFKKWIKNEGMSYFSDNKKAILLAAFKAGRKSAFLESFDMIESELGSGIIGKILKTFRKKP